MITKVFKKRGFFSVLGTVTLLILTTPILAMAAAAPKGEVVIGYYSPLTTDMLDPATYGITTFTMILSTIHDALVKGMPGETFGKNLATSWKGSKDGMMYEFKLRKGVKFHNGDTVTAADVKFSFDRYKGQSAALFKKKVREVEVVDDYTVRFHFTSPWSDFLTFYGSQASAAAYVIPKKYFEQVGEMGFFRNPVGAGPYKFVEFKPGERLVVEAFEGYWRKVPSVKRIIIREITQEASRVAALKANETDYAIMISGSLLDDVYKDQRFKIFPCYAGNSFFMDFFDRRDPKSPFHDYRVRKAVSLAMDRKTISDAVWHGLAKPMGNVIDAGFMYGLPAKPDPYDPEQARRLLKEAGYPPGSIKVDLNRYPSFMKATGEMVAGYLQAVGIDANIVALEKAAFLQKWSSRQLKGLGTWITGVPGNAATRLETFVVPGGTYSSMPKGAEPEFEELYEKQAVELDTEKRKEMLYKMQKMMIEGMWQVPLLEFPSCHAVGPRIKEPALELIPLWNYIGPYDEIQLKP